MGLDKYYFNMKIENKNFISVVIVAYNEEKNIGDCLKSILDQTIKPDEIVIIDDGSVDETSKIASKFPVKLFKIKHSERSKARNIGWQKASGDIICFAEADSVFNKDWLKEIIKKFNGGADVVIDRRRMYQPKTFLQKCLDAQFDIRYAYYTPFSAWAFKREVLEKAGGYDKKLNQSEERDLGKRIKKMGYKILLAEKATQYHKGEPKNLREYLKRAFITEKRKAQGYLKKYPGEISFMNLEIFLVSLIFFVLIFIDLKFLFLFLSFLSFVYFLIFYKVSFKEKGWSVIKKNYIFGLSFLRTLKIFSTSLGFIVGKLS
jgi:glycosyltransferase involved in cell wall biosynthesis